MANNITVYLLFTKNKNEEPGAILRFDKTNKFYDGNFYSWKDAIHFLGYYEHKMNMNMKINENIYSIDFLNKIYNKWFNKYGYNHFEEFIGNSNEFINICKDGYNTSIGTISPNVNLCNISAWTYEEK